MVPAYFRRTWAVNGSQVVVAMAGRPAQAYDAATGTKGPAFATQEPYVSALTVAGGVCYALDATGIFYAFDAASGEEIWHQQLLSTENSPGTGVAVENGLAFLGSVAGTLYAVSTTSGKVQWAYQPGSGLDTDLTVTRGVIYLRDNNGTVHAVSTATHKPLWSQPSGAAVTDGVTVAAGQAYYSTVFALQAVDAATGSPAWSFTPPGTTEVLSTPVAANAFVYVGAHDGNLYAIKA